MIRLTWLLVAIALAVYGAGLVAGGDVFAGYRLRDGLIVAVLAMLIAVRHGAAPARTGAAGGRRAWPIAAKVLTGVALACGLVAGVPAYAGMALGGPEMLRWFGLSLWGVGSLSMAAALFWPSRVEVYPPPAYHWVVDAAGRWVRMTLDDPQDATRSAALSRRAQWGWLALILLVSVGLRMWRLTTLPPTCVESECALALQLVEGSWAAGPALDLYAVLAGLLWRLTGDGVAALRWTSVLLGSGFLLAFYWAARAYTRPAGALAGLFMAGLLPWAVWASRLGSAWSVAALLLALALGACGRGLAGAGGLRARLWWGVTGLALGLLLAQPIPLATATVVWAAALVLLAGANTRRDAAAFLPSAGTLVSALVAVGMPGLVLATHTATGGDAWQLAGGLLHSGGAALDYFLDNPLLPTFVTGLILVGAAILLRHGTSAAAIWLGGAIFGLTVAVAPPVGLSADVLLPLLPFVLLAAGVAADQVISVFDRAWTKLVPLPRTMVGVTLLLLLILGRDALALTGQLRGAGASAQNDVEVAMARYLAACLAGEQPDDPCSRQGEDAPLFYAPPAVVDHPATRLLVGAALTDGRVAPLDPARDLLPATAPTGDLIYLVGLDNQPVIELLRQLYPSATLAAGPRDGIGGTLFLVITITRAEALAHQGLQGRYFSASPAGGDAAVTRQDGPLFFEWGASAPVDAPFYAEWEGSLLAPRAGAYTFALAGVDGPDAGASPPVVSVQLDGKLVLDTSLGLVEQRELLVEGYYRLAVRYRTDSPPGDWAILWTPPGGEPAPIPRPALYSPALPNLGLTGTYYAGREWSGPALAVRKDLILAADVDLPRPYSVLWTGKVAATRAGEYLFSATANGPVFLAIDGQELLSYLPPDDLADGPAYDQAGLYLASGWHDIAIRYAPAERSDLRLLWTQPGSAPSLLMSRELLPTTAEVTTADVPLPAAPELMDARLGDDTFALTTNVEFYQPSKSAPPVALPVLLAEPLWEAANGCGAGPEQLDSPRGATLDASAQRLYIADANNRRVVVLDANSGAPLEQLAFPDLQEPVDVAFEAGGTLLVLDAVSQAIYRVDGVTGEYGSVPLTGFYRPRGLAIDGADNILVADTGGARVAMVDITGTVLAQFGGPSSWLGQGQPVDVLATNGSYWAIAAEHGRLWRLDVLGSLPAIEPANTLTGPHLAGLPDGSFFVSDPARRTVLYFTPNGQPYGQLTAADFFLNPTGVATALHDGLVYVAVADSTRCGVSMWRVRPVSD